MASTCQKTLKGANEAAAEMEKEAEEKEAEENEGQDMEDDEELEVVRDPNWSDAVKDAAIANWPKLPTEAEVDNGDETEIKTKDGAAATKGETDDGITATMATTSNTTKPTDAAVAKKKGVGHNDFANPNA